VVSALGGAVLERYLLPVLPIVYIAFAISLTALLPQPGRWTLAALLSCLIAAAFINPLYPFPFENNLAFVSFVNLQEKAAAAVQTRSGTLATAFPMADAFRRPEFGFVWQSRRIQEIESFRAGDIARLAADPPDLMIVYDTVWDPLHLVRNFMSSWMRRYYDYEPAMPPDAIAQKLSMRVARRWELHGLSMSLLERNP
jgi:hypothetical protein